MSWIGAQLAEHERGGDSALLDGSGQSQDFVPLRGDLLGVNGSTDESFQRRITGGLFYAKESSLTKMPNPRSKRNPSRWQSANYR